MAKVRVGRSCVRVWAEWGRCVSHFLRLAVVQLPTSCAQGGGVVGVTSTGVELCLPRGVFVLSRRVGWSGHQRPLVGLWFGGCLWASGSVVAW